MTKKSDKTIELGRGEWRKGQYARHYFDAERSYLDAGLRQSVGPSVLQIGQRLPEEIVDEFDLPFLVKTNEFLDNLSDVVVDPAFLPFSPSVFSTVILPHVLERSAFPHQVLREAHRILMPEGHIVLTGFNPVSLIGLQRWLRPSAVCPGRYYSVGRVIDWLQLLGFDVVASSMFHYGPLSNSERFKNAFQFIESIGDRWLPMTGGGYMISAKKRDAGLNMVGRRKFKISKPKMAAPTAAKTQYRPENET